MMIRVLFFGKVRELARTDSLVIDWREQLTPQKVIAELLSQGEPWNQALDGRLLVAINQSMQPPETELSDGDELALFPPVTGG